MKGNAQKPAAGAEQTGPNQHDVTPSDEEVQSAGSVAYVVTAGALEEPWPELPEVAPPKPRSSVRDKIKQFETRL